LNLSIRALTITDLLTASNPSSKRSKACRAPAPAATVVAKMVVQKGSWHTCVGSLVVSFS
jgi:hypothetical protein